MNRISHIKSFQMTPQAPVEIERSKNRVQVGLEKCLLIGVSFFVLSPLLTYLFGSDTSTALALKSVIATVAGYVCWFVLLMLLFVQTSSRRSFSSFGKIQNPWFLSPLVSVGLFLLWALLCSAFSRWTSIAFFGNGWRHEGWVQYFAYTGLFVSVLLLAGNSLWHRIRTLWFVAAMVTAGVALGERAGWFPFEWSLRGQSASFFINSNHLGYYLCMTAVLAAGLWVHEHAKSGLVHAAARPFLERCAAPALSLLLFTALAYTRTRGSYIALFVGLFALAVMLREKNSLRSFHPFGLALIVFFLLHLFDPVLSLDKINLIGSNIAAILTDPSSKEALESGGSRWELWMDAINYIGRSPVIGIGPDTAGFLLQQDGIFFSDRVHNEYLEYAVTIGIPGLLAWLAFLVFSLRRAFLPSKPPATLPGAALVNRAFSSEAIVAACAALTYLVSAFFGNSLTYVAPFLFILLGRAAAGREHPDA
jgi:O-antigen ligase